MKTILMHRRTFLSEVGLTMAAACTACLAACSKSDSTGTTTNPSNPGGGGNTSNTVNFNVSLDTQLLNVGDFIYSGAVIVTRIAAANEVASFSAVSSKCTHQGGTIGFENALGKYVCPNHGSQFNPNGSVAQGPAATALKAYTLTLTGTTLNVKG